MHANALRMAALALVVAAGAADAADRPGRFTMSPVDGGAFVRLDTETGAMSICRPERTELICRPAAGDDTANREEFERLRRENLALKAEIRRLEELLLPTERGPDGKPPNPGQARPPVLQLPTEEDVDRAMGYLERLFKRFQERMKDLEPKDKGTPL